MKRIPLFDRKNASNSSCSNDAIEKAILESQRQSKVLIENQNIHLSALEQLSAESGKLLYQHNEQLKGLNDKSNSIANSSNFIACVATFATFCSIIISIYFYQNSIDTQRRMIDYQIASKNLSEIQNQITFKGDQLGIETYCFDREKIKSKEDIEYFTDISGWIELLEPDKSKIRLSQLMVNFPPSVQTLISERPIGAIRRWDILPEIMLSWAYQEKYPDGIYSELGWSEEKLKKFMSVNLLANDFESLEKKLVDGITLARQDEAILKMLMSVTNRMYQIFTKDRFDNEGYLLNFMFSTKEGFDRFPYYFGYGLDKEEFDAMPKHCQRVYKQIDERMQDVQREKRIVTSWNSEGPSPGY
jgi:hypothetical protein